MLHEPKRYFILVLSFCFGLVLCSLLWLLSLTLADFDDYVLRLGRNSPTPADAMRFGMLSMRLDIQEQDMPKVILRRFMIDVDGTAEAALHANTKIDVPTGEH